MRILPIYTTRGDAGAFVAYPHVYNPVGEWVGFITAGREVYSVLGYYVGYLTEDRRIVRERNPSTPKAHLEAPPSPVNIRPPATVPLAPLMGELTYSTIDVLLEEPERLHTLDVGELREDMD
jgi:hypothetical protein